MTSFIMLWENAEGIRMTQEVIDIILSKLEKIENDVSELKAFKNKLLGLMTGLSIIFGFLFDAVKSWFAGK